MSPSTSECGELARARRALEAERRLAREESVFYSLARHLALAERVRRLEREENR